MELPQLHQLPMAPHAQEATGNEEGVEAITEVVEDEAEAMELGKIEVETGRGAEVVTTLAHRAR